MNANNIKILYVVSTLRKTGPTNQLLGIVKNLDSELFDIKVLTLSPEPPDSMLEEFTKLNINIETLGLNRIRFFIYGKTTLKRFINEYSPDIIHTSGVRADVAVSKLKLYKDKHCMTVRNFAHEDYIAKYGVIMGKILANNSIKAMKKCSYVICCSKSLRDMYEKTLKQNFNVIQNGVDTNKYQPTENQQEKARIRKKLGLPSEKIIFLVVGSLIKRKDPITIIDAFNLSNLENKAILVFLGDGALMEECKIKSNDSIILKGNVNNVTDYLKASDFYISASKSEGLPNSVLEAGSTGLNLILSNIPQHQEIFYNNKEIVDFFEVGNVQMLSNKINQAIKTGNRDVNNALSEYIKNNFSNKIMSEKYKKMYLSIIKKNA